MAGGAFHDLALPLLLPFVAVLPLALPPVVALLPVDALPPAHPVNATQTTAAAAIPRHALLHFQLMPTAPSSEQSPENIISLLTPKVCYFRSNYIIVARRRSNPPRTKRTAQA
jgi:hypothetical protein